MERAGESPAEGRTPIRATPRQFTVIPLKAQHAFVAVTGLAAVLALLVGVWVVSRGSTTAIGMPSDIGAVTTDGSSAGSSALVSGGDELLMNLRKWLDISYMESDGDYGGAGFGHVAAHYLEAGSIYDTYIGLLTEKYVGVPHVRSADVASWIASGFGAGGVFRESEHDLTALQATWLAAKSLAELGAVQRVPTATYEYIKSLQRPSGLFAQPGHDTRDLVLRDTYTALDILSLHHEGIDDTVRQRALTQLLPVANEAVTLTAGHIDDHTLMALYGVSIASPSAISPEMRSRLESEFLDATQELGSSDADIYLYALTSIYARVPYTTPNAYRIQLGEYLRSAVVPRMRVNEDAGAKALPLNTVVDWMAWCSAAQIACPHREFAALVERYRMGPYWMRIGRATYPSRAVTVAGLHLSQAVGNDRMDPRALETYLRDGIDELKARREDPAMRPLRNALEGLRLLGAELDPASSREIQALMDRWLLGIQKPGPNHIEVFSEYSRILLQEGWRPSAAASTRVEAFLSLALSDPVYYDLEPLELAVLQALPGIRNINDEMIVARARSRFVDGGYLDGRVLLPNLDATADAILALKMIDRLDAVPIDEVASFVWRSQGRYGFHHGPTSEDMSRDYSLLSTDAGITILQRIGRMPRLAAVPLPRLDISRR